MSPGYVVLSIKPICLSAAGAVTVKLNELEVPKMEGVKAPDDGTPANWGFMLIPTLPEGAVGRFDGSIMGLLFVSAATCTVKVHGLRIIHSVEPGSQSASVVVVLDLTISNENVPGLEAYASFSESPP